MSGTIIDVQVFTREGIDRDDRAETIISAQLEAYQQDLDDQKRIVEEDTFTRVEKAIINQSVVGGPKPLKKGDKISKENLSEIERYEWFDIRLKEDKDSKH